MMAQGMPDPKGVVATLKGSTAKIDAAEEAAVNPAVKRGMTGSIPGLDVKATRKSEVVMSADGKRGGAGPIIDDDAPITADKAAAGLARAKANEAALVKAAGAPKPPGVMDKLKALVGVK
jgi:hypothetical protein